ncbi:MAG: SLC13 family permease [Caldisphaera sp.]|nr:SLC13 family permease [Caldisphaera sp.]
MLIIKDMILIIIIIISISLLLMRKLRHDIIGVATMVALVLLGYISPQNALDNFGSITIIVFISTMIISGTLADSGLLEILGNILASKIKSEKILLLVLLFLIVVASGFVSDVALTLAFMPLIYSISSRLNKHSSKYLLPLAYSAILGGRYTLIGTSSNIIIANEWYNKFGTQLNILQFAKIGLIESFISVIIIILVIVPIIGKGGSEITSLKQISVSDYIIEAQITGESNFKGKSLKSVEKALGVKVIRVISPWRFIGSSRKLKEGDILVLRIRPDQLPLLLSSKGLKITEKSEQEKQFFELLITSSSKIINRRISELQLEERYNVSIIGVASGRSLYRISDYTLSSGDVLLVQGKEEDVAKLASVYTLMPLAGKGPKPFDKRKAIMAITGLGLAIAISYLGISLSISFLTGALISSLSGLSTVRKLYDYIEWPAVIFIGSYLTIGEVMESSGLTGIIGLFIHNSPIILFLVALILSNTIGYVATAIILAPVALSFPNPLLGATILSMSVSSPFLTPFAHQANLIVYSAAGYKIRDYLISGSIIIVVIMFITFYYFHLIPIAQIYFNHYS